MTNSEAIDIAESWMLKQEQRCVVGGDTACTYYDASTGNMCAVGVLLGPEVAHQLDEWIEGLGITGTWDKVIDAVDRIAGLGAAAPAVEALDGVDVEMLLGLQRIHDVKRASEPCGLRTAESRAEIKAECAALRARFATNHGAV